MAKKFLVGSFLVLILILGTGYIYKATANEKLAIDKIGSNDSSIHIHWNKGGDLYRIVDGEGKVIYEGNQTQYKISGLEKERPYSFTLKSLDKNNEVIESLIIKTNTTPLKKELAKSRNEKNKQLINYAQLHAVIGDKSVTLFWEDMPKNKGNFEILRDGESLGKLETNKFEDTNIELDKTYVYEVRSSVEFEESVIDEEVKKLKKNKINLNKEEKAQLFSDEFSLIKIVDMPKKKVAKNGIQAASTVQPGYGIVYSTFIPTDKVPNPLKDFFPLAHWFNGNDRSYGLYKNDCPSYNKGGCLEDNVKTRVITTVTFTPTRPLFTYHPPKIGHTTAYTKNRKPTKTVIDKPTIRPNVESKSSDFIKYSVYHNSNNPLALLFGKKKPIGAPDLAPGITYEHTTSIWKNGTMNMQGSHDLAPNHEVYFISYPGHDGLRIYKRDLVSFNALIPILNVKYGKGYINVTR